MSKKVLFIIVGLVILISIIIFFFGFLNSSKKDVSENIDASIIPTINLENKENTQTFYEMEISVPENWNFEKVSFPGGESFIMRPKSNPPGSYFPSIGIERRPLSSRSELENRIGLFLNSGMQEVSKQINGETITGAIGVNPLTTNIDGVDSSYYDALFLYPYGDSVYFIEYKYEGTTESIELEGIFDTVISSIKFN